MRLAEERGAAFRQTEDDDVSEADYFDELTSPNLMRTRADACLANVNSDRLAGSSPLAETNFTC